MSDLMKEDYLKPVSLIDGPITLKQLDDQIAGPTETVIPPVKWWIGFLLGPVVMLLIGCWGMFQIAQHGLGVWGNNNTIAWAFDIINFVYWIGIAHAGTAISAVLYVTRQQWRTAVARFAEAMTIFSVACAMIFPVIHTGRPWLAQYLMPYPNERNLWVNFTSPLLWDVFAVTTYGSCSFAFWYLGLVPDFAVIRDRAKSGLRKVIYSVLSLGWRNSNRHWQHYEKAYMVVAGVCTGLVVVVSTVVSSDFATSVIPGWHATIFPLYFTLGAIYCGFAAVQLTLLAVRWFFKMEHIITVKHLDRLSKVVLLMCWIMTYIYVFEIVFAIYSGNPYEKFLVINRAVGPYCWAFWTLMFANAVVPQLYWIKKCRTNLFAIVLVTVGINIGMWFERFVIIVTSLHRDFLPSNWSYYIPTAVDFSLYIGSWGLFTALVMLFVRYLPVISIAELKGVIDGAQPSHHNEEGGH